MSARRRSEPSSEAGFTLIELLVSTFLLSLLLVIVGSILISSLRTQQAVSTVSTAATTAQSVASVIGDRIRNSSEFRVSTPTGTDQLIVARTAGTGTALDWVCYGWYYSAASGGSIRMTTTVPGTKIVAPTAAQLATWTLIASGITPRSGTSIFSASGSQLTIAFNATTGGRAPVAIVFSTARLTGAQEAGTCY